MLIYIGELLQEWGPKVFWPAIYVSSFFSVISLGYFFFIKGNKRDNTYLFYALYCLSLALLLHRNNHIVKLQVLPCPNLYFGFFDLVRMTLPVVFYAGFIVCFTNDKKQGERELRLLKNFMFTVIGILLLYNLTFLFLLQYPSNHEILHFMLANFPKFGISIGVTAIVLFIFKFRSYPLMDFIIAGSLSIAIGAGLSYTLNESPNGSISENCFKAISGQNSHYQLFFQIGILLDIIIIAIALAKRNQINAESFEKTISPPTTTTKEDTIILNIGPRFIKVELGKILFIEKREGDKKFVATYKLLEQEEEFLATRTAEVTEHSTKAQLLEALNSPVKFHLIRARVPIQVVSREYIKEVRRITQNNRKCLMVLMQNGTKFMVAINRSNVFWNWWDE